MLNSGRAKLQERNRALFLFSQTQSSSESGNTRTTRIPRVCRDIASYHVRLLFATRAPFACALARCDASPFPFHFPWARRLLSHPAYAEKVIVMVRPAFAKILRQIGARKGKVIERTKIESLLQTAVAFECDRLCRVPISGTIELVSNPVEIIEFVNYRHCVNAVTSSRNEIFL